MSSDAAAAGGLSIARHTVPAMLASVVSAVWRLAEAARDIVSRAEEIYGAAPLGAAVTYNSSNPVFGVLVMYHKHAKLSSFFVFTSKRFQVEVDINVVWFAWMHRRTFIEMREELPEDGTVIVVAPPLKATQLRMFLEGIPVKPIQGTRWWTQSVFYYRNTRAALCDSTVTRVNAASSLEEQTAAMQTIADLDLCSSEKFLVTTLDVISPKDFFPYSIWLYGNKTKPCAAAVTDDGESGSILHQGRSFSRHWFIVGLCSRTPGAGKALFLAIAEMARRAGVPIVMLQPAGSEVRKLYKTWGMVDQVANTNKATNTSECKLVYLTAPLATFKAL